MSLITTPGRNPEVARTGKMLNYLILNSSIGRISAVIASQDNNNFTTVETDKVN